MAYPLVSGFCPTMGRPELIEQVITMWSLQSYQERELLILDTVEQMPELEGDRWRIMRIGRLIPNWRDGYSMGLLVNLGIRATTGPLVVRIDDDDQYAPWHLAACQEALVDHHWACPYSTWDAQYGKILLYRTYQERHGPRAVAYAGAWSFRRDAFEALGGYHEGNFREDECEFRDRLAARYGDPGDTTAGKFPASSYLYAPHHKTIVHYGQCTDDQRRAYQQQPWPTWDSITPRWPTNYLQGLPRDATIQPRRF